MKRYLLAKFLQKWSESGHKRKKQIIIVMGLFAFFGMGILVLSAWLSIKFGGFLWNEVKTLKPSGLITQIQDSEKPIYNVATCLNQLNSLFTLDPWVNAPISEIFRTTYQKCIQPIEIKPSKLHSEEKL